MIRELGRNAETNWYEKIQLEMTLSDLQYIYDCIGAVPPKYVEIKHKHSSFNRDESIYRDISTDLYESLHTILSEHNGVTDDDMMINTNIELDIDMGYDEE